MSILGVVVRTQPTSLGVVLARAATMAGVDVALNPGDGRLVLVIEDAEKDGAVCSAATAMEAIARWPELLSTTLAYEYSGPDAPASHDRDITEFRAWRGTSPPA